MSFFVVFLPVFIFSRIYNSHLQVSKIVSYVLRHGAEGDGIPNISMDDDKQVEVVDLLAICRRCCAITSYEQLVEMLKDSNEEKRRYY